MKAEVRKTLAGVVNWRRGMGQAKRGMRGRRGLRRISHTSCFKGGTWSNIEHPYEKSTN